MCRFILLSESDVPLYDPLSLYYQVCDWQLRGKHQCTLMHDTLPTMITHRAKPSSRRSCLKSIQG